MERHQVFAGEDRWLGWVRTIPAMEGGWHHHGEHDSYIYVLRGTLYIDSGPGGRDRVTGGANDVIFVPKRMVHREVTPPGEPTDVFVVRYGSGAPNFNVDSADPE